MLALPCLLAAGRQSRLPRRMALRERGWLRWARRPRVCPCCWSRLARAESAAAKQVAWRLGRRWLSATSGLQGAT